MKIFQQKTQTMQGSPIPLVGQFDHIIVGEYQLFTEKQNDWFYVNITAVAGSNVFTWQNRAGVKWDLTLVEEVEPGTLMFDVGEDCPYYQNGYTTANLYYKIDSTEEVEIEGPSWELYKKLGGGPYSTTTTSSSTSTTSTASTPAPSTDTGVTTNSDTSPATSKVPPPSASTQTVLLSTGAGILLIIMLIAAAVFITSKRSKKQKEQKEKREEVVDENPVYQQYELVGENYERQYSTHEVVDCNDYYE